MIVRKIRQEEYKRVQQLCALAFEYTYPDSGKTHQEIFERMIREPKSRQDLCWDAQWAAFADDDTTMMSTFIAIPYTANFDGRRVSMTGIGGVATLPPYRRQGGIRACFEAALPDMYRSGVVFSYLYPFSTEYYRKFGYELGCDRVRYTLRLAGLPRIHTNGRCILLEGGEDLIPAFQAVDSVWQARYNMMIHTDAFDYRWVREADPFAKGEYTYLYLSPDGAPKGYFSYKLAVSGGERRMEVSRLVFTDSEGFYGLLALMLTTASDHSHAVFFLPNDIDLSAMLPEWSLGVISREIQSFGMVRVINAQRALLIAKARGTGSFVLELSDAQIAENNGRLAVRYADGRVTDVSPTQAPPDVSMGIAAFSRMLAGRCDLDAYPALPDVQIYGREDALRGVFYRKPMYINTAF